MNRAVFFDQLGQSRLLSPEQLTRLAERFAGEDSASVIVTALLDEGRLTSFQARQLSTGKGKELAVGQYRLLAELGRGGFGRVYKALHAVMDRVVALKVLAPQVAEDAQVRSWFRREVLASTRLAHPNIVMAYDANEADGALFLVMEYVDGFDLDTLVRRQGPLPVGAACEVFRQAAQALQYAHDKGLVHRDIKPANLLVPRTGATPVAVKVVDFGLARLYDTTTGASLLSQGDRGFVGTPDYVAPEQAKDPHAADIRSDLYSLGCSFYFALSGRKPFVGSTVFQTVMKHLEGNAEPIESLRPELPAAVAAIVRRLMAREPVRRFQTPAELVAELAFLCGPEAERPAPRPVPTAAIALPPSPLRVVEPASESPVLAGATALIPELAFAIGGAAPSLREPPTSSEYHRGSLHTEQDFSVSLPPGLDPGDASGRSPKPLVETPLPLPEPPLPPPLPPPVEETLPDAAQLQRQWRDWVAVVEALARRGDAEGVSESVYRALHTQLLAGCRRLAAVAEENQRVPLRRLVALLEPWLTPRALAATDTATLRSVLRTGQEIEHQLGWDNNYLGTWLMAALVACVAIAVGVAVGISGCLSL